MKIIFSILFCLFLIPILSAQSISMQQIGSIGGEVKNANTGSLTHSIGATASTVINNQNSQLDQGFFLACDLCGNCSTTVIDDLEAWLAPKISFYPNPTQGLIYLDGEARYRSFFQLFNPLGELVLTSPLKGENLDLGQISPGIYILKVYGYQNELSAIFKVIKH